MRWTITNRAGWLRVFDDKRTDCVLASAVELVGTARGGFRISTSSETLNFECDADEARCHVARLYELLAKA